MNRYVAQRSTTPPPPYIYQNMPNSDTVMPLPVNNFTNTTHSYNDVQAQAQGLNASPTYHTILNPLHHNRVNPVNVIILPPIQTLNRNYRQLPPRNYLIWSVVSIVGSFLASTCCIFL